MASEENKQAILKLDKQVNDAREKCAAQAERAAGVGKLEEIMSLIGFLGGMIAGPLLVMNFLDIDGKEVIAAYFGTIAGAAAGGYAGKCTAKFINYLRRYERKNESVCTNCMDQTVTRLTEDDYTRIGKEDNTKEDSGIFSGG